MTVYNTRLFKEQKQYVKKLLNSDFFDMLEFSHYEEQGLTVCIATKGNKVFTGGAYCSVLENKFRPSVGRYYSLMRMIENFEMEAQKFNQEMVFEWFQQFNEQF